METQLLNFNNDDLNNFEDEEVRNFLFYIKYWYKTENEYKDILFNLYCWISKTKPTIERIRKDKSRLKQINLMLEKFTAEKGDDMGGLSLYDFKEKLN